MFMTSKRILLVSETKSQILDKIREKFREINAQLMDLNRVTTELVENQDLIVLLGSDKGFLRLHQLMKERTVPVLGIAPSGEIGFLTEISTNEIKKAVEAITNDEYSIEECLRISVWVDGEPGLYAVNDAAIFPFRSATLMEYELIVDNRLIWRDYSDGIVIATPIGSTAYAMSAGGPLIMSNVDVLSVVPVNSVDLTRRPLIVSSKSEIVITEIHSRHRCEVIVDGLQRRKIRREVRIKKARENMKIVRLMKEKIFEDRLVKKIKLAEELMKAPPSVKLILRILQEYGPLSLRDIITKSMLPPRTVRYALSYLASRGLIRKKTMIRDVRRSIYELSEKISEI